MLQQLGAVNLGHRCHAIMLLDLRCLENMADDSHRCSGAFAAYAAFQWQIGALARNSWCEGPGVALQLWLLEALVDQPDHLISLRVTMLWCMCCLSGVVASLANG